MSFHQTSPEQHPADSDLRAGLRALREGDFTVQQPMSFVRIMFHAALLDLIETRGARYFLSPKGRAFINGEEWSNVT